MTTKPKKWSAPKYEAIRTPTPKLEPQHTDKIPAEVVDAFRKMHPEVKIELMYNSGGRNFTYIFFYHINGWLYRSVWNMREKGVCWDKTLQFITKNELPVPVLNFLKENYPNVDDVQVCLKTRPKGGTVYSIFTGDERLAVDLDGRLIFRMYTTESKFT